MEYNSTISKFCLLLLSKMCFSISIDTIDVYTKRCKKCFYSKVLTCLFRSNFCLHVGQWKNVSIYILPFFYLMFHSAVTTLHFPSILLFVPFVTLHVATCLCLSYPFFSDMCIAFVSVSSLSCFYLSFCLYLFLLFHVSTIIIFVFLSVP